VQDEAHPHGDRINMGAYGGTVEASKSPGFSVPGQVSNLSIKGGHRRIILKWDDPNDGGYEILSYKIYRGPTAGSLSDYTQVPGNELDYADFGVENGTEYYYAVAATNELGEGEQSTPVNIIAIWSESDVNGDGAIDLVDYAVMCTEWLWEAPWHKP
jgi:hypothetical protein